MKTYFNEIITNLFQFKQLPSVSSERQIGLLLMPFLEQLFDNYELVTVELPLKKQTSNQSKKVDFVMKCKNEKIILLIELKTDKNMFDEKQLAFYSRSDNNNIQWQKIYSNIKNIVEKGNMNSYRRFKYFNLFMILLEKGLISVTIDNFEEIIDSIKQKRFSIDRKPLCERSKQIKELFRNSNPINYSTKLIYLMPNSEKNIKSLKRKNIDFHTFDQLPEVKEYSEEYTALLKQLKEI